MNFDEFIKSLSIEDKTNFEIYSKVRGVQLYKIIFEHLIKIDSNITYNDVNSFVKYDKSLKDILFKFLGTIEEFIKVFIFSHFDLDENKKLQKKYRYLSNIKKVIVSKEIPFGEITELYKRFSLIFSDIVDFLEEFDTTQFFNINNLNKVSELRNKVMHHTPLLFDSSGQSTVKINEDRIQALIDSLPDFYKQFIRDEINEKTIKIKGRVNKNYFDLILKTF